MYDIHNLIDNLFKLSELDVIFGNSKGPTVVNVFLLITNTFLIKNVRME